MSSVPGGRGRGQVVRVHAEPVLTLVVEAMPFGDRADESLVGEPVSVVPTGVALTDDGVAVLGGLADVEPASVVAPFRECYQTREGVGSLVVAELLNEPTPLRACVVAGVLVNAGSLACTTTDKHSNGRSQLRRPTGTRRTGPVRRAGRGAEGCRPTRGRSGGRCRSRSTGGTDYTAWRPYWLST